MDFLDRTPRRYLFGPFALDRRAAELRKRGIRVKLPRQALDVLTALVEHSGEVVTREELRDALWQKDTFVDFDHSLNVAISKIRLVLDESEDRKLIETLPRVGYRFLLPVEVVDTSGPRLDTALSSVPAPAPKPPVRRRWLIAVCLAGATVLLGAAVLMFVSAHARRPIRSLAVLPLVNLSNSPEQDYFADGMTEALITDLAKIGQLRVVSGTSAMQYKGAHKNLPMIGRELKVSALIEGAVMRSAGRVRITVQLIDAATDEHLWAETYERDLRDVLGLQSEVAQAVAGEIRVRLTEQDKARLAPARKVDPAAYDAYLRGWYFINRRRFDEFPKAQEYLQKAVALQPDYALAWAALAQCPLLMVREPQERTRQTTAAARRALELDSTLGEAHVMLGMANTYDFHWTAAEQEFRKAIELSPNSFPAHTSYAMFLVSVGRFDESLAETAKAVELDPLSPLGHFHAGICNFFSRRYAQAIAHFRKAFEIDPSYPWAHDFLAEVYEVKKMYPEALAEYRLSGSVPLLPNADWRACWETELAKSKDRLAAGQRVATFKMALTYVHLGRNGEAIEWMEKGVAERDANMGQLAVQPLFDGLRSDPRFVRLLQRMGLPIVNSIGSSCRHLSAGVVCQSIVEPGQAAAGPAPQPLLACLDAAPGFREASFRR